MTFVIVCDTAIPEMYVDTRDDDWPKSACALDGEYAEPHIHWSILTIEDGMVTNWDWGYHSETEARRYVFDPERTHREEEYDVRFDAS